MKYLDLIALPFLFLGCFGSVFLLPPESFILGQNFLSYLLILGGYGLLLLSIYLSFFKFDLDKKSFLLKGMLFVPAGILYTVYGLSASVPFLKILGALLLFFVLIYYGQALSDGLMILLAFAAVKSHYFSALIIRYDFEEAPLHRVDLFYLIIGAILIFQFFVVSKNLKTHLDFSLKGKDLLWITALVFLLLVVLIPVGFSFKWLQYNPRSFGVQQWIPLLFYYFGVVAPLEEIFFRGIILDRLRFILFDKNPYGIPLLISSLAFGLAHLPSFSLTIAAMIGGFSYGAGYLLTKRISTPILIHGLINILWVTLFYTPR
jgi:membrane protease YdiL (CAAX protease family)